MRPASSPRKKGGFTLLEEGEGSATTRARGTPSLAKNGETTQQPATRAVAGARRSGCTEPAGQRAAGRRVADRPQNTLGSTDAHSPPAVAAALTALAALPTVAATVTTPTNLNPLQQHQKKVLPSRRHGATRPIYWTGGSRMSVAGSTERHATGAELRHGGERKSKQTVPRRGYGYEASMRPTMRLGTCAALPHEVLRVATLTASAELDSTVVVPV